MPLIDLTGRKFGRLTVIARGINWRRVVRWRCLCSCGVETLVASQSLRVGKTWSCGCGRRDQAVRRLQTHGQSSTPEFAIWCGIKARCENPNVRAFPHYGGRGISVCSRWRIGENGKTGFECFLEDMGRRPSKAHSIDRYPDCNGNYGPENCRWATKHQQVNNRRNTRTVKYRGLVMPLTDAVRLAGSVIHREAAWGRIKTGWSVAKAIETPRLFESHASKSRIAYRRAGEAEAV